MNKIITKDQIRDLKKTIINRGYPVRVTRNYLEANGAVCPYGLMKEVIIKDNFIICHEETGSSVRIDERGFTVFPVEWFAKIANGLLAYLKENDLLDTLIELCNQQGNDKVADDVFDRYMKERQSVC